MKTMYAGTTGRTQGDRKETIPAQKAKKKGMSGKAIGC
jgi:hypothetical protein